MTRKHRWREVVRATFTIIGEMYRELPRTMAIATAWLLLLLGLVVWTGINKGWLYALGLLAVWVVIGVGLTWLNRWAAKGDGIDDK